MIVKNYPLLRFYRKTQSIHLTVSNGVHSQDFARHNTYTHVKHMLINVLVAKKLLGRTSVMVISNLYYIQRRKVFNSEFKCIKCFYNHVPN